MKKFAILMTALMTVACASPKPSETQVSNDSSNKATTSVDNPTLSTSQNTSTNSNPMKTPANGGTATNTTANNTESQPEDAVTTAAKLAADLQRLHNESIYFDYNDFVVKPESRDLLKRQAAKFLSKKATVLVLEGNADERGSVEYNFALGEKRSTSVKKVLLTFGVPVAKIKVVSFGNTKPKLDCHEEKCWQENRRVDFVFN
jgi:peptidoglycan-associated lipoprotein